MNTVFSTNCVVCSGSGARNRFGIDWGQQTITAQRSVVCWCQDEVDLTPGEYLTFTVSFSHDVFPIWTPKEASR